MQVNGTLMNSYFYCKRQCYLLGNRLNLQDDSEQIKIGREIHKQLAEGKKNTEIVIDNIRLDELTKDYAIEIKKSDAGAEGARWQLLFYLSILKSKGIVRKGKLEFLEVHENGKKTEVIELTRNKEKELKQHIEEIEALLESNEVPECTCKNSCDRCSYYEYCSI